MSAINLESLGFTQEELQERVIDRICESLLSSIEYDPEDGGEYPVASKFKQLIDKRISQQVDETINALAEKHVIPNVTQYIETLTLQETNAWGEKRGEPVSFIEYLTQRAQEYMQEKVNFEGKTKAEAGSYSWSGAQTRITHMIHQHLHYSIESAMKQAMQVATGEIAKGLQETAKIKLGEIASNLKVQVSTK